MKKKKFLDIISLIEKKDIVIFAFTGISGFILQMIFDFLSTNLKFTSSFIIELDGKGVLISVLLIFLLIYIPQLYYKYKYRFYSDDKEAFDYKHESVSAHMQFKTKEKIDYIKSAKIYDKKIDELYVDYMWSGNKIESITPSSHKDNNFDLFVPIKGKNGNNSNGDIYEKSTLIAKGMNISLGSKYKVIPKEKTFSSDFDYSIVFKLIDENSEMKLMSGIMVDRPSKQLVLTLTFPEDIKVKNVRIKRKILVGECKEEDISYKYPVAEKRHGHSDGHYSNEGITYQVIVKNPKMPYNYYLTWEWDGVQ